MEVKFYSIIKRENSTFTADGLAPVATVNCVLKDECSIMKPVLILADTNMKTQLYVVNYCYIADFKRFYWVRNWSYEGARIFAECDVDVLASFKNEIINDTVYVLRSSATYDLDLFDTFYPTKASKHYGNLTFDMYEGRVNDYSRGEIIVEFSGGDGISEFYIFSPNGFSKFSTDMFSNVDWLKKEFTSEGVSFDELGDGLVMMAVNPLQYVRSVRWYPFIIEEGPTFTTGISFGFWVFENKPEYECRLLSANYEQSLTKTVEIPEHPQLSRGTFLNASPYRNITFWSMFTGEFTVDATDLIPDPNLKCTIFIDYRTGKSVFTCYNSKMVFASIPYNIGVDMAVGGVLVNPAQASETALALNALGALVTGNASKYAGSVVSGIEARGGKAMSKGVTGSTLSAISNMRVTVEFALLSDEGLSENGRPCYKFTTMAEGGKGYYLIKDGECSLEYAYLDEVQRVKSYLETGVFYE